EAVFDRFMQRVLYDRNKKLLAKIRPALDEGGYFIAVGALHLPDERGLLQALADAGYQISRVY
ncbi:MAG: TraB/GumN family protein, partial [Gammaproteobacteria bacterium]